MSNVLCCVCIRLCIAVTQNSINVQTPNPVRPINIESLPRAPMTHDECVCVSRTRCAKQRADGQRLSVN